MPTTKSLLQRVLTQAWNQGDLAGVNELIAIEGSDRAPSGREATGRMGLKQLIAAFRIAFPDLHCTVEDEISTGDKVAARWTMHGTHQGPFLGNRPTGRPVVARGLIFARIEHNRIAEEWTLVDQMGILQQLGLIPPSGY